MNYRKNAEIVKKFLVDNEVPYEECEYDRQIVYGGWIYHHKGEHDLYDGLKYFLVVGDGEIQSYVRMPALAGKRLAEINEYITRANHGLRHGAFELNYDDGEVRFHVAFPSCVLEVDAEESIAMLLCAGVAMVQKYASGYMKVLMGDRAPEAAIAEIEK